MIRFTLQCEKEHGFEAWFRSGDDFTAQREKKIVTCPVCGSSSVEKSLMAPNIGVKGNRKTEAATGTRLPAKPTSPYGTPEAPAASPSLAEAAAGLPPEVRQHVVTLAREIRDHVRKTSDDVGERFAEEARKIHYEESTPRGIYGKASPAEARELLDEGIEVHPLPLLPEDRN